MYQYKISNLALDPVTNFGKVTVSTGYNNVTTVIVLNSGEGSKLPNPSTDGPFNLVWYNSTDYPDPSDDPNVEIVRCTDNISDVLTITRAQEDTTAKNHNLPTKIYRMILAPTKKMFTDILSDTQSRVDTHAALLSTHGILGNIVGTTDIQTLTNKTISGNNNTISNIDFETAIKQSTFQNQSFQNLLKNGNFEFWSAGPTSSPDGWSIGFVTIVKNTSNYKYGLASAAMTYGSQAGYIFNTDFNIPSFYQGYGGKTITFGCWIKTNIANQIRLSIWTNSTAPVAFSAYHTGSGNWEFLTLTIIVEPSPTRLQAVINIEAAGTAYLDGAILVEGSVVPAFAPHPFDTVLAEPRFKVSSFTHDVSTTGPQSIAGIGFKPGSLALLGVIPNSHAVTMALSDFSYTGGVYNNTAESPGWDTTSILRFKTGSGTSATFTLNPTADSDGFTGTWAKFGSPTGIAYIYYLASR